MQKKLADYFRILIEQKDNLLSEYYDPRALLRSEEAVLITGLLFSLNIVDCNLCLKVKQNNINLSSNKSNQNNSTQFSQNAIHLFVHTFSGREP